MLTFIFCHDSRWVSVSKMYPLYDINSYSMLYSHIDEKRLSIEVLRFEFLLCFPRNCDESKFWCAHLIQLWIWITDALGGFCTPLPPTHATLPRYFLNEWYDGGLMINSPAYINHAVAILDSDSLTTTNQQHVRTYNKLLEN